MGLKMDLHMHSTFSNGTMRPVDLVKKYHAEEYSLISLTDHDTLDGVREAQIAGEALGIQVIPGIELTTVLERRTELHILGYHIDIENKSLCQTLEQVHAGEGSTLDSVEAVHLLREAGGIPSLAHPFKIEGIGEPGSESFYENLDSILRTLKKAGLKGLECFHPSATHEQGLRLVKFAEKYHLHVTEGSDYHGPEI